MQLKATSRRSPAAAVPRRSSKRASRVIGIELELPEAPPARFRLLWDEAPKTCTAVTAALPKRADCMHASYSGTITAFYIDSKVVAPTENATTCLIPGDLVFTHYDAGVRHGYLNALSEIYWPYDRYARPTIPGQFVTLDAANVFGAFDGAPEVWRAFAARCKRIRLEGKSTIKVRTY